MKIYKNEFPLSKIIIPRSRHQQGIVIEIIICGSQS